ncbi:hypothetical protein GACE_2036 [Geoglobus acetivorans]|uniref:Uncharacterized protein n=2 Tax=Geoglobus acetivorans TaxID=565033 RepID=A0A0A7GG49_GEOAI|nr:hypothetical protein GACE_2036 [Geoglobus acetivorans]
MVGLAITPLTTSDAGIALAVYGYRNGDLPSLTGGLATVGSGVAGLGAGIVAVAGMESLSTLALAGCAVTGVGLGIVIG